MFWVILSAVFCALCLFKIIEDVELDNPILRPFVYLISAIMYPFIWVSERKLPKNERTPFF